MKTVRFRPEAEDDVAEAAGFYASRAPDLGEDFLLEVQRAVERAASDPNRGARYRMGTRRVILRRFPFHLVYRTEADFIWVVAVAHQSRRPSYWSGRARG